MHTIYHHENQFNIFHFGTCPLNGMGIHFRFADWRRKVTVPFQVFGVSLSFDIEYSWCILNRHVRILASKWTVLHSGNQNNWLNQCIVGCYSFNCKYLQMNSLIRTSFCISIKTCVVLCYSVQFDGRWWYWFYLGILITYCSMRYKMFKWR